MNQEILNAIVKKLIEKKYKISFCESCTGGLLVSMLVSVSGASKVLEESYVTYSEVAKKKILGVKDTTLKEYTVYSQGVAVEMAKGLYQITNSNVCISITGHAGGDENSENGVAYSSIIINNVLYNKKIIVSGTRNEVREKFCEKIFEWLTGLLN